MKRFIYALLGIGCFVLLVSCQNVLHSPLKQPSSQAPLTTSPPNPEPAPIPTEILAPPPASSDRLRTDISAIATERYTDAQRLETRQYIEAALKRNQWAIEEQPFPNGINIIARRPDYNPEQRDILIGAHYDSVPGTPGADDNATGVAATLELSSIFQAYPSPKNLILVLFDLEERRALGSMDYVQHPQNLTNLDGAIILEMLGYTCHTPQCQGIPPELEVSPPSSLGDFLSVIGDTEHPSLIKAFRNVSSPLELLALDVPFKGLLTPILLRSDHAPFWLKGKGAVMVSDTAFLRNPHYHRSTDSAETIDYEFLTESTNFVAQAAATILHSPTTTKPPIAQEQEEA